MIYLDNVIATKPSDAAIFAMMPFLQQAYGAPSQPHQMGQEVVGYLEKYYRTLYQLLSVNESDTFIFTSSGAEAISQVMHSVYRSVARHTGKNHFVISPFAEVATVSAIKALHDDGVVLQQAKATASGKVSLDTISEAITPRTALISLPWACPLTGVVQPIEEIAALCKQRAILLHVDATHALGKLYGSMEDMGANYITFNGEQIHAPRGSGGLFVRQAPIHPFICGGTLNVALLAALSQAALEAEENKMLYCTEVARLRDKLEQGISQGCSNACCLFQNEERLPHVSAISFSGIRNEALLFVLNQKKVFASMGIDNSALTFSLSKETKEADIDRAVEIIVESVKRLRRLCAAF